MTLQFDEIKRTAESFGPWYHSIKLTPEYAAPSHMLKGNGTIWDNTRAVRKAVDYKGKAVLDLGSMEGMWAFEAEEAGAEKVIAADIFQNTDGQGMFDRFCFARFVRNSRVCMVPNAEICDLKNRLDSIFRAWNLRDGFDIIQNLGLLYHVQNPMLAIQQCRKCCKGGAVMLVETACSIDGGSSLRCNYDRSFYGDDSTYFIPTEQCLLEMLALSGFKARENSARRVRADRIALIADAVDWDDRQERFG